MADYQIIDLGADDEEEFDILDSEGETTGERMSLDAEEVLDFILEQSADTTFAFGEFEVDQEGAISRMKTIYGVFR